MKTFIKFGILVSLITILILGMSNPQMGFAQDETPLTDTATVVVTNAVVDTPVPQVSFERPLVVINSYHYGNDTITPGNDFPLKILLKNNGESDAYNMVISFESTDFLPLTSGGVRIVPHLDTGASIEIEQPMRANASLWGYSSGSIIANVSYTDERGASYTERFTLTIDLRIPVYSTAQPTATPTLQPRAQLVVGGYEVDVNPLQPGTIFNLSVDIRNLGSTVANDVTMVLGGGVSVPSGQDGTGGQQAGGVTGSGADLTVFAPLGTSNLIFIDTVEVGKMVRASTQLIVNVTANPGAYPFKISFTYLNDKGERVIDDQVITLLVYSLPKVEIGFYRSPGIFMAGQMNPLPVQITNLGKTTAVLGTMIISSENADLSENTILIGALEPGGYFTIDAMAMPYTEGELNLLVSVSYTDDFNQPRTIEQRLNVMVDPQAVFEPFPGDGMGGNGFPEMPSDQPETFWQKVVRFFKGLFGLGSGKSAPDNLNSPMPGEYQEEVPPEEVPLKPIPAPKG
jgi:hypothetical protein